MNKHNKNGSRRNNPYWNAFRRAGESGNVFIALFGAVALVGVLGVTASGIMRGPMKTMAEVSQKAQAESEIMSNIKLSVMGVAELTTQDCDLDSTIEAVPFDTGTGPTGGGLLPAAIRTSSRTDPWGTTYGYCVWDHGTAVDAAGCGGASQNRLPGLNTTTFPSGNISGQTVIGIISAGPNRAFETTCRDWAAADIHGGSADGDLNDANDLSLLAKGGDDLVLSFNYGEASVATSSTWKLKDTTGDAAADSTAELDADKVELAGDKVEIGDASTANTGLLDLTQGGLLLPQDPGDDTISGACNSANDNQLRVNTGGTSPALEICTGGNWEQISGNAGTGSSCVAYTPNAVDFDSSDYLSTNTASGAPSSSTKFSGSFWVKRDATGNIDIILATGTPDTSVDILADNSLYIIIADSTNSAVVNMRSTATFTSTTNWYHVMFSFDLTDTAKRHLYINGVADTLVVSTYNTSGTMDFSDNESGIGNDYAVWAPNNFEGQLADVWFDYDSYIDLSVAANREKFLNTNGTPKYLGSRGELPTGSVPHIFLSGDTANWHNNRGTVKGFNAVGTVTDAASDPAAGTDCTNKIADTCTGLGDAAYTDSYSKYCYYKETTGTTWANAKTACEGNGGYLFAPTSQQESVAVASNLSVASEHFIGASDITTEGTWLWEGGELSGSQFWSGLAAGSSVGGLYSNWNSTEPNNNGGVQDCMSFGSNANRSLWHDTNCATSFPYVCELAPITNIPADYTTGLVHHWTLDETTVNNGSPIEDSVGAEDSVVTGTLASVSGIDGTAITIDADNEYIDFGTVAALQGVSQFTLSAWMKRSSSGALVALGSLDGSDAGAYINFWTFGGRAYFGVSDGGVEEGYTLSNDTAWHHLTLVYDGTETGNANRLKGYVDGQPVSLTFTGTVPATSSSASLDFIIGAVPPASLFSRGSFDDIRIYDRPLSAADVEGLYDSYDGLNAGLVGHWKLDEGSGTTANDSSGNTNTGTLTNGPTWGTGIDGGAVTFDGTNDYITIPDSTSFGTLTNEATFAAWVYVPSAITGFAPIFQQQSNLDTALETIGIIVDDVAEDTIYVTMTSVSDGFVFLNTNHGFEDYYGQWVHIAGVYDGTNLKSYINGVETNSTPITGTLENNTRPYTIGAGQNAGTVNEFIDATIDDVRVYKRAFTEEQIQELYLATGGTSGSNVENAQDCNGLGDAYYNDATTGHCYYREDGRVISKDLAQASCESNGGYLVTITSAAEQTIIENLYPAANQFWLGGGDEVVEGEWRWLDGPDEGTQFWQGTSGGSAVGGAYTNWLAGEPNAASSAEDCMRIGYSDTTTWIDEACTTSAPGEGFICEKSPPVACNPDSGPCAPGPGQALLEDFTANQSVTQSASAANTMSTFGTVIGIESEDVGAEAGIDFLVKSSPADTDMPTAGIAAARSSVIDGKAGLAFKTRNDSDEYETRAFLDGDGDFGIDMSAPADVAATIQMREISDGTWSTNYTQGLLIHGGEDTEIENTSNSVTNGLVAHWTFDEGTGLSAADSSGNGNTGTLVNGPVWTSGGLAGNALVFDSSDDYVTIANSTSINLDQAGSISFWYKPASVTGFHNIIVKGNTGGIAQYGAEQFDDEIEFYNRDGAAHNGSYRYTRTTNANMVAGNWYHFVVTFNDATSTINIYKNGVLLSGYSSNGAYVDVQQTTQPLRIGEAINGEETNGTIDDVRIFNRAISSSEVLSLFSQNVSVPENGLVVHYSFDEGIGQYAYDSSPNENHGTLVNLPTWDSTGRIDGSLLFDYQGANGNHVVAPYNSSMDGTSFTISSWAKLDMSDFNSTERYVIFDRDDAGDYIFGMGWEGGGTDQYGCGFDMVGGGFAYAVAPMTPDDQWHHLACSFNNATMELKIYLDNVEVDTYIATSGLFPGVADLTIGKDTFYNSHEFNGNLDDVRVYNRALSDAEISSIYAYEGATRNATAYLGQTNTFAIPVTSCEDFGANGGSTIPETGNCYFLTTTGGSYATRRTECQSYGGDLAVIESAEENSFVATNVLLNAGVSTAFIGGTDSAVEGTWIWSRTGVQFWNGTTSGSAVNGMYAQWGATEPNASTAGSDCIELGDDGSWNDGGCGAAWTGVCEIEGTIFNPSSTVLYGNSLVIADTSDISATTVTEMMRMDSEGLTTFSSTFVDMIDAQFGTTSNSSTLTESGSVVFERSRGTNAIPSNLSSGDVIGSLSYAGRSSSGMPTDANAAIYAKTSGAAGSGTVPTELHFSTDSAGAATSSSDMVIKSDGSIGIGTTTVSGKTQVAGRSTFNDGLRLGEDNACTSAADEGVLRVSSGELEYCDGSAWLPMGASGLGSSDIEPSILYSWGGDAVNAVGGYTTGGATVNTPTAKTSIYGVVKADAGTNMTCVLTDAGNIWCWGEQTFTSLANGVSTGSTAVPQKITHPSGLRWTDVSTDNFASCAVDSAKKIYCWGRGGNRQMGDGATANNTTPGLISDGGTLSWAKVDVGFTHACAITTSNDAYCWGANSKGQVGNGNTTNQDVPRAVINGLKFSDISAGSDVTCGVTTAGAVYCWGESSVDPFGTGQVVGTDRSSPTAAAIGNITFTQVSVGEQPCAISSDNNMYCWGQSVLYNGTTYPTFGLMPAPWGVGRKWKQVSLGYGTGCALTMEGKAYCWGEGTNGQIGNAGSANQQYPTAVSGNLNFSYIDAGDNHNTAILDADIHHLSTGVQWGTDSSNMLGNDSAATNRLVPVAISGRNDWIYLAGGPTVSCGISQNYDAYCWGSDSDGSLGNGAGGDTPTPGLVTANIPLKWKMLSSGSGGATRVCGITLQGYAYCWGAESAGSLGNDSTNTTTRQSPGEEAHVTGGHTFTHIAADSLDVVCGVVDSGDGYCWGEETTGNLGNGGAASQILHDPTIVTGSHKWKKILPGTLHTCGLRTDGAAYCWGDDQYGQLGDAAADSGDQVSPVAVGGGHLFQDLEVGAHNACGIKNNGEMYCWGRNQVGQNGDNSTTNRFTPVAINTTSIGNITWKKVVINGEGSTVCGLTTNNLVYCWGGNAHGNLGINQPAPPTWYSTVPVPVQLETSVIDIFEGGSGYEEFNNIFAIVGNNDTLVTADCNAGEIEFADLYTSSTSTNVTTETVTISGVKGTCRLGIASESPSASIVLNSVVQSTKSVVVDNGDTIALQIQSPASYGTSFDTYLTIGNHKTTHTTTTDRKIVFATSSQHDGDLDDIAGADSICAARALEAGLSGTFLPWIADNLPLATYPAARFSLWNYHYVLPNGTKVADDWLDLTDGTLDSAISRDEDGVAVTGNTWTNVNRAGLVRGFNTNTDACNEWTSNLGGQTAYRGLTTSTTNTWTETSRSGNCDPGSKPRLFCFQQ